MRLHVDAAADAQSRSLGARAFTAGSDVVFARGQYDPTSSAGRRLLAHELVHVVQRSRGAGGVPAVLRACGRGVRAGEPCTPQSGDITDYGATSDDHYQFEVSCDDFAPGEQARLERYVQGGAFARSGPLHIHGFASEEGDTGLNDRLSCARAIKARDTIRSAIGSAPQLGLSVFRHGATPGVRVPRRSVVLDRGPFESPLPEPEPSACPPAAGTTAGTMAEYVELIRCAEATTGLDPTRMLALLRQMYYGKSWSATSTTSRWDDVIPCSPGVGHPRPLLGAALFDALHGSVTVDGVDVGHVFTGLEAMRCPRSRVDLSSLLPAGTVRMENEAFATWGGDLGAAAAAMVACWDMNPGERLRSEDCGRADPPRALPFYLLQVHAPREDLEGDIAAYVMRAAALGIPCTGSARQPLVLGGPVSELFTEFYRDTGPAGRTHRDRFHCFAEAVGGSLSGNRITNKPQLVQRYAPAVESFATAFYIKIMKDSRGAIPAHRIVPAGGSVIRLRQHSVTVVSHFLDFVEHQL